MAGNRFFQLIILGNVWRDSILNHDTLLFVVGIIDMGAFAAQKILLILIIDFILLYILKFINVLKLRVTIISNKVAGSIVALCNYL